MATKLVATESAPYPAAGPPRGDTYDVYLAGRSQCWRARGPGSQGRIRGPVAEARAGDVQAGVRFQHSAPSAACCATAQSRFSGPPPHSKLVWLSIFYQRVRQRSLALRTRSPQFLHHSRGLESAQAQAVWRRCTQRVLVEHLERPADHTPLSCSSCSAREPTLVQQARDFPDGPLLQPAPRRGGF